MKAKLPHIIPAEHVPGAMAVLALGIMFIDEACDSERFTDYLERYRPQLYDRLLATLAIVTEEGSNGQSDAPLRAMIVRFLEEEIDPVVLQRLRKELRGRKE